jgi:hypothetical protein
MTVIFGEPSITPSTIAGGATQLEIAIDVSRDTPGSLHVQWMKDDPSASGGASLVPTGALDVATAPVGETFVAVLTRVLGADDGRYFPRFSTPTEPIVDGPAVVVADVHLTVSNVHVTPSLPQPAGTTVTLTGDVTRDTAGQLQATWAKLDDTGGFDPSTGFVAIGVALDTTATTNQVFALVADVAIGSTTAGTYVLVASDPMTGVQSAGDPIMIKATPEPDDGQSGRLLWVRVSELGPGPLADHALVYDAGRDRVVLYGGRAASDPTSGLRTGTWEFDGTYWVQLSNLPPGGTSFGLMAYDHTRTCVVFHADTRTFEWDGAVWRQVADDGPEGDILCDGRGVVTLLAARAPISSTWTWDGLHWTKVTEGQLPVASGGAATFVLTRDIVVAAGGHQPDGSAQQGTWEWDGSSWIERSHFGPARDGAHLAHVAGAVVLVGGQDDASLEGSPHSDTWHWDGTYWTQRLSFGVDPPRRGAQLASDSKRGRIISYGGASADGALLADTWVYELYG